MNIITWIAIVLSFAVPITISLFNLEHKESTLVIVEFVAQIATLGMLGTFLKNVSSKAEIGKKIFYTNLLLFITIAFALFADVLYNLRIIGFLKFERSDFLYLLNQIFYSGFAISLLMLTCLILRRHLVKERAWILISSVIFILDVYICHKYIMAHYYLMDIPFSLKINTTIYSVVVCMLAAIVIPFSVRTTQRKFFIFLQWIFLYIISDFSNRYQIIFVDNSVFSFMEFMWASMFIGFFWLVFLSRKDNCFIEEKIEMAPYKSVRSLGTIAITGANILFLLGILVFGFYSVDKAMDISNILLLMYVFWLVANEVSYRISADLKLIMPTLFQKTEHVSNEDGLIRYKLDKVNTKSPISEISQIFNSYNGLVDQANKVIELSSSLSRNQAIIDTASQVSHDIRSPLAALNMAVSTLREIDEDKRFLIKNATQRIGHIANQLLQKGKAEGVENFLLKEVMVTSLLENILEEKRIEFHDRPFIKIVGDFNAGIGSFVKVDSTELSRVISNLINNSVEAIGESGEVIVLVSVSQEEIFISIRDNGKGIPDEYLQRLGEKGASFGKSGEKKSGSGLGLFYAKKVIANFSGALEISSKVGFGTEVRIKLPRSSSPQWFLSRILLTDNQFVISVSDDEAIHRLWAERFRKNNFNSAYLKFHSIEQIENWLESNRSNEVFFIIDYDFKLSLSTYTKVLKKFDISKKSVFVVSRIDDELQNHSIELGYKIVSKSYVPLIPIDVVAKEKPFDAVLIDDDSLVHAMWKVAAKQKHKRIQCFYSFNEFYQQMSTVNTITPLYVDISLGAGVNGQDVAQQLYELGYKNIFFSTGHRVSDIKKPDFIIDVIGKDPVF